MHTERERGGQIKESDDVIVFVLHNIYIPESKPSVTNIIQCGLKLRFLLLFTTFEPPRALSILSISIQFWRYN